MHTHKNMWRRGNKTPPNSSNPHKTDPEGTNGEESKDQIEELYKTNSLKKS